MLGMRLFSFTLVPSIHSNAFEAVPTEAERIVFNRPDPSAAVLLRFGFDPDAVMGGDATTSDVALSIGLRRRWIGLSEGG
jgi:hypothetical protein